MADLLDEMLQCQSVRACIDLALTDAYGEEEEAVAWLTCIEAMLGRRLAFFLKRVAVARIMDMIHGSPFDSLADALTAIQASFDTTHERPVLHSSARLRRTQSADHKWQKWGMGGGRGSQ